VFTFVTVFVGPHGFISVCMFLGCLPCGLNRW
jgi:hypothetical protein